MYCEDEGLPQFFETAVPKGVRRMDAGADESSVGYVTAAENLYKAGHLLDEWRIEDPLL